MAAHDIYTFISSSLDERRKKNFLLSKSKKLSLSYILHVSSLFFVTNSQWINTNAYIDGLAQSLNYVA